MPDAYGTATPAARITIITESGTRSCANAQAATALARQEAEYQQEAMHVTARYPSKGPPEYAVIPRYVWQRQTYRHRFYTILTTVQPEGTHTA